MGRSARSSCAISLSDLLASLQLSLVITPCQQEAHCIASPAFLKLIVG